MSDMKVAKVTVDRNMGPGDGLQKINRIGQRQFLFHNSEYENVLRSFCNVSSKWCKNS